MHQTAFIPWAMAALLPLALCAPTFGIGLGASFHDKQITVCSADTSDAAVVPSANYKWAQDMTNCANGMSGDSNDGVTCTPKDDGGSALGPTFSFWKSQTGKDQDPADCFNKCIYCLIEGIDNHRAVTTSCQFKTFYALGPAIKSTCNMGFDYGTMQPNQANMTT